MGIAIDFGTSNTVIARWNPVTQQPETLTIPGLSIQQSLNPPLIPSLVYIEEATQGKVLVGQEVRDRGFDLKNDTRFFRSFKRGIGADIQGFLPEIDGENITFEQVGQLFLTQVIEKLAPTQGGLDSLILTVPVDSFEAYRHWLGKVCQALPVERVQMVDEPTAAALGYGLADQEILLVIDFGGGTLDLSLVRLDQSVQTKKPIGFLLKWGNKSLGDNSRQKPKTARVLAKAGQNLGGTDIDAWLVDYFAKTQGLAVTPLTTRLAERVKIQLSTQNQASEVYFDDENFESYELSLSREVLEDILKEQGFFAQLDESMTSLLQQARRQGIEVADINAVLLVGGTVQLPAVQTWVKKYFQPEKIRCERPFEAIAQGALQLAQGMEIKDFLYHSYGVRYWDRRNQRHNWHSIIKTGQAYPMSESVELVLGASLENQPSIELIIGELGSQTASTEVYFDGDRLITRRMEEGGTSVKPLNDQAGARTIAQLTPPGFPGSDRIKILFQVDEQRFLRITVEDLLTNDTLLENQLVAQLS
ncbi:Hsp70 family protein [Nodularia spumigena CS-584]|jgi:molecular chaperone DnaK (HSP70)|uniref:Chaperone protein DnaK n=1 Tax=Nodularia spumigena UHCC 0039 TaxID=1914872 RepID=A0A2S0QAI4_NODSP|nr:Hsp70 family protein [Nodularia spumigena]AHJ30559.1 Chaperone protein DnaK [Nodularia spumigena CCY9414]AVZ31655.1 chaperone protein DnaK [Nodularia spumigena UHCC 0039]EAW43694.1 Heat shock protein [Nodularia spumigena CCY9414]MDB9383735.1 Hsp70 family protein [Nodularia spumigena CS-584]MEA5554898.1 Hsp70 family protein [Nodularia spumigena CH309]